MYEKVNPNLNFVEREKEIIEFWKKNEIFEKSVEKNEGKEEFSFYDGPPTANGKPHIGHILTRVMKDIVPRYKTMKGYHVLRKAGWDTHGLPVVNPGRDADFDLRAFGDISCPFTIGTFFFDHFPRAAALRTYLHIAGHAEQ